MREWLRNEDGQDLIEYLMLGSFVSIVALIGATMLGTQLNVWYKSMADWVGSASATIPSATP